MAIQIFRQMAKRIANHADKIGATGDRTAEATHDIPLRKIIGDDQDLAVILKAVGGALDQIIRRLTAAGKNHFHRTAGLVPGFAAPGANPVKEDRYRCAAGVLVLGEHFYQRISRRLGMPRRPLGQLRPAVQQRISIHQDANQRHDASI